MIDPGTGTLRIVRGGLLALICSLLAAGGHAGAGGSLPPLPAMIATGAVLGGAFVVLAGKERGFAQIAAAATASQLLFHAAFTLTAPGHAEHSGVLPDSTGMLVAHLTGGAVLAGLARHGEALFWALAGLLGVARIPSVAVVPVRKPLSVTDCRVDLPDPRIRVEARICPRRGPPCA